ncbi:unnamed protein product [Gongylonema pulchrum]|uniref:Uncharacterized protein n=1 Tax=Gongylonema pulchrum TaxID=637853 RepID=A0A183DRR4_9BILA|nr:unnamed protein product [Gongylonema pulchrum]
MNINYKYATPYYSKGNALISHDTGCLSEDGCSADQRNWCQLLPYIAWCYNISVHDTTHESPFSLVFGRDPIFCANVILDPQTHEEDVEDDHATILSIAAPQNKPNIVHFNQIKPFHLLGKQDTTQTQMDMVPEYLVPQQTKKPGQSISARNNLRRRSG